MRSMRILLFILALLLPFPLFAQDAGAVDLGLSNGCLNGGGLTGSRQIAIRVNNRTRTAWITAPAVPASAPRPLLVGLPGANSNGQLFSMSPLNVASGFAVQPFQILLDGGRTPYARTGWYWDTSTAAAEDMNFIQAAIYYMIDNYCVDPRNVHLYGYSAGGFLVNAFASLYPDMITSASIISGGGVVQAARDSLPILIVHGSADAIVPVSEAQAVRDKFAEVNSCDVSGPVNTAPAPCVTYACTTGLVYCVYSGGTHWPSPTVVTAVSTFVASHNAEAGVPPDATLDAGTDSGFADAAPADTGVPPDSGIPPDTGIFPDAQPVDTGIPPDSGILPDSGVLVADNSCARWPQGATGEAYFVYAQQPLLNDTAFATIAYRLVPETSLPTTEGVIIERDTASSLQQNIRLTVIANGAIRVGIASSLTTLAVFESFTGVLVAGASTRVVIVYDGTQATNATRLRVFAGVGTAALVQLNAASFTGTVPARMTAPTTAPASSPPWTIGRRFGGGLPLRNVALCEIAIWSGVRASAAQRNEIAPAGFVGFPNLRNTSMGDPIALWTFSGNTNDSIGSLGASGQFAGTVTFGDYSPASTLQVQQPVYPGAGEAIVAGTVQTSFTVMANGVPTLRSALLVPPASNATPRPCVWNFHGCSYSGATVRSESVGSGIWDIEPNAGTGSCFVYPDGLQGPKNDGFECPTVAQTGWDVTQNRSTNRDVPAIDKTMTMVRSLWNVEPAQFFMAGRSMGCGFVSQMACLYAGTFRAFAGSSCARDPVPNCVSPYSIIYTHNAGDPTTPVAIGDQCRDDAVLTNMCGSPVADAVYPVCTNYSCAGGGVTYCREPGGGHPPAVDAGEQTLRFWRSLPGSGI